jgi:hypothetical protein
LQKKRFISRSCKIKKSEIDVEKPGGQLFSNLPLLIYTIFLLSKENSGAKPKAE